MLRWTQFDVHGLASVQVDQAAPGEPQLALMLAAFQTASAPAEADITVTGEPERPSAPAFAETAYSYDLAGIYEPRLSVTRSGDRWRIGGTGELLGVTMPVLDRVCADRGAAMVHAATLDIGGRGVCLASWGGVGKTSTVSRMLKLPEVRFMGDDWAFIAESGDLLGWAKPLFLKPHHKALYPEVFSGKRKPLVPPRLTRSLNTVATAVHPTIARYPRLAGFTRRWSPEHHIVPPGEVFGADRISTKAPLSGLAFVERYGGDTAVFEQISEHELVSRCVGNFHSELPRQSRELITAFGATGLSGMQDHFGAKAAVIGKVASTVATGLIRIPAAWPPADAAKAIGDFTLDKLV